MWQLSTDTGVQMPKKDQHSKPGAVRKGGKMEANTVSCGASNKSFWSPDLAGQMAMSEG